MEPIRIAIIGAGNIARIHAEAARLTDGAEVAVVCDRSGDPGRELAAAYGARWTADAREAVSARDVDAVVITTPSGAHAELVVAAAEHGKHALVEKPLDIRLERCDLMIAAAKRHETVLAGVFQSRFGAGVRRAREAVAGGRLGRLVLANAFVPWHRPPAYYAGGGWRGTRALDGGGALMNQGIHTVDLLLHLAGRVARVSSETRTRVHAIEVEDTAAAVLGFVGGHVGALAAATSCWPGTGARVELYGERGTVVLEEGRIVRWALRDGAPDEEAAMLALESAGGSGSSDPMAIGVGKHQLQMRDFVEAARGEHPPAVSGEDARVAVELVLAVYRAAETGCAVDVAAAG